MSACNLTYFGKYRGTVLNNVDPMQRGRIQAAVPDVSNLVPTSWAMPCLPLAGPQMGIFMVPPVGAGVWIEFEQGDPDFPIWVGCFTGTAADVPGPARAVPPAVSGITLQTTAQNGIAISDAPGPQGGIVIRSRTGATIIVDDTGIYIRNGKGASIEMTGKTVRINQDALVIDPVP
ncbi:MAG: phage baseplate assembly protein V [Longimicrobiaceae bacterium]